VRDEIASRYDKECCSWQLITPGRGSPNLPFGAGPSEAVGRRSDIALDQGICPVADRGGTVSRYPGSGRDGQALLEAGHIAGRGRHALTSLFRLADTLGGDDDPRMSDYLRQKVRGAGLSHLDR
jgi:hypothetical protein